MDEFRGLEPSHHLGEGKKLRAPLSATSVPALCLAVFAHSVFLFVLSASLADWLCSFSVSSVSFYLSLILSDLSHRLPLLSGTVCPQGSLRVTLRLCVSLGLCRSRVVCLLRVSCPRATLQQHVFSCPCIYTRLPCTVCSQVPTQGPGLSSGRRVALGRWWPLCGQAWRSQLLCCPHPSPDWCRKSSRRCRGSGGNSVQESKCSWEGREHRLTDHPHTQRQTLSGR